MRVLFSGTQTILPSRGLISRRPNTLTANDVFTRLSIDLRFSGTEKLQLVKPRVDDKAILQSLLELTYTDGVEKQGGSHVPVAEVLVHLDNEQTRDKPMDGVNPEELAGFKEDKQRLEELLQRGVLVAVIDSDTNKALSYGYLEGLDPGEPDEMTDSWFYVQSTVSSKLEKDQHQLIFDATVNIAREKGCQTLWISLPKEPEDFLEFYKRQGFKTDASQTITWNQKSVPGERLLYTVPLAK